ncbi:MAG: T9SS C-terminal target domain-containing protein [Ignavibacteriales bacterium]|nr:MAG: T9SS C-terminal target domain-containing protein [Ignavibacteriales bacterium]
MVKSKKVFDKMKLSIIYKKEFNLSGSFLLFALFLLVNNPINAQTLTITGKVYASSTPVQNAAVSFEDMGGDGKIYNAITDSTGFYKVVVDGVTSVEYSSDIPTKFVLAQNYPNPFSTSTVIPYEVMVPSEVEITVYDVLGRQVKKYNVGLKSTGINSIQWDGRNDLGSKVSTGIYFYCLKAGNEMQVKKMVFNSGTIAGPHLSHQNIPALIYKTGNSIDETSEVKYFIIRIENTANTLPKIISKQIEYVKVSNDTTINVVVDSQASAYTANIYPDSLQQVIRGFGAANILRWRPDMTSDQVDKAFGVGDGKLGFSILRLRVPYNASETEFGYNVATAKLAASYGAIIFASPWTPPAHMKSNNNIVGGYLKESSYSQYAAHLKSFVDYMARNNVPLYAISIQNEPDVTVTYESCDWQPSEMVKFVKENGASIGTKIILPESFNFNHMISDAVLNDPEAEKNVAIIGGHIYGGGLTSYPFAAEKNKELWMTEHLDLDTTWAGVMNTAKEINDCMNAGMNAYVWWYIIRFYGPIHESGAITKRGYVMSQYSRFIRPEYHKIKCSSAPQRNVYVTSYKSDDGKLVVVAVNKGTVSVEQNFHIVNGSVISVIPYTTSASRNCEKASDINVTDGNFLYELEPSSITTFISN